MRPLWKAIGATDSKAITATGIEQAYEVSDFAYEPESTRNEQNEQKRNGFTNNVIRQKGSLQICQIKAKQIQGTNYIRKNLGSPSLTNNDSSERMRQT